MAKTNSPFPIPVWRSPLQLEELKPRQNKMLKTNRTSTLLEKRSEVAGPCSWIIKMHDQKNQTSGGLMNPMALFPRLDSSRNEFLWILWEMQMRNDTITMQQVNF